VDGLLSPAINDLLRVAILTLSIVNVIVLLVVVRTLRQNARLLVDMEHFARETRNAVRKREERSTPDLERASRALGR
jgi:hypothetical protein